MKKTLEQETPKVCSRCKKELGLIYWSDGFDRLCCECRDFIKRLQDELKAKHPLIFEYNSDKDSQVIQKDPKCKSCICDDRKEHLECCECRDYDKYVSR
jgi:hypothetical protein